MNKAQILGFCLLSFAFMGCGDDVPPAGSDAGIDSGGSDSGSDASQDAAPSDTSVDPGAIDSARVDTGPEPDSGPVDSGTDSGASEFSTRFCDAERAREVRCDGDVTDERYAGCLEQFGCLEPFLRADVLAVAHMCGERECGVSDDACLAPESYGLTPSETAIAYNEACLTRRRTCAGDPYGDDFCFISPATDPVIQSLQLCLEMEMCADIRTCFRTVIDC